MFSTDLIPSTWPSPTFQPGPRTVHCLVSEAPCARRAAGLTCHGGNAPRKTEVFSAWKLGNAGFGTGTPGRPWEIDGKLVTYFWVFKSAHWPCVLTGSCKRQLFMLAAWHSQMGQLSHLAESIWEPWLLLFLLFIQQAFVTQMCLKTKICIKASLGSNLLKEHSLAVGCLGCSSTVRHSLRVDKSWAGNGRQPELTACQHECWSIWNPALRQQR